NGRTHVRTNVEPLMKLRRAAEGAAARAERRGDDSRHWPCQHARRSFRDDDPGRALRGRHLRLMLADQRFEPGFLRGGETLHLCDLSGHLVALLVGQRDEISPLLREDVELIARTLLRELL